MCGIIVISGLSDKLCYPNIVFRRRGEEFASENYWGFPPRIPVAASGESDAQSRNFALGVHVWKEFYLTINAAGRALWWDEAAGAEADFAIEPGTGFWVERKSGPATLGVNAQRAGTCYKTPPPVLMTISSSGWNVVGPPSHRAVHHGNTEAQTQYSTPANQIGFATGGSAGSTKDIRPPPDSGDQIWVWEDNEWKTYYWLMGHLGPQWDGKWWDIRNNDFADFALVPGRAYYYRHRTNRWGGEDFF